MFLIDRLNHWATETPDTPAIVFEEQTLTFARLRSSSHAVAQWLEDQKVRAGDRVAYLGLNHPVQLVLFFACAQLGAIWTPFNTRLAPGEYDYLLEDSEPGICLFDDDFAQIVQKLGTVRCPMINTDQLPQNGKESRLLTTSAEPDSALLLVYTSGTTGRPKGVVLSHDAVAANIENSQDLYSFEPGRRVQITLPLFHVGGLCILLLPALMHGATIYLHRRFDPEATLIQIPSASITETLWVPAQMSALMVLPNWQACDFSSLNTVVVGSSVIPENQIIRIHDKGIPVSQLYGATETGPGAIGLKLNDAFDHVGSAGTVLKLCQIEIRDPDHRELADGERGNVWVKGPNILNHYWRNEEETAEVLVDGWYNTGDIGYRDSDGFFWIVDRSKDLIISGGENIYPAEVERVALEHPAISAVAVIGKPDPHWGETPVAAVELCAGFTLVEDEFLQFFQNKIARYKHPKKVLVLDPMPRNSMGKIEKQVLRDMVREQ